MSVLYCAEIGSMHKGEKSLAYELIRQAANAGAEICKFQLGWTSGTQTLYAHNYNPIRFIDDWAPDLAKWCEQFGVEFMASIWSMEGLEAARAVGMKRYKIASQVAGDGQFINTVLADKKETFISTANWTPTEQVRPLYCVSKYPAYPDDVAMADFCGGYYYGYSDHSHGIGACLLAVARGARYIEKHFCLDKTDLAVRDTVFSSTPDEFRDLVKYGREIEMFR